MTVYFFIAVSFLYLFPMPVSAPGGEAGAVTSWDTPNPVTGAGRALTAGRARRGWHDAGNNRKETMKKTEAAEGETCLPEPGIYETVNRSRNCALQPYRLAHDGKLPAQIIDAGFILAEVDRLIIHTRHDQ